MSSQDIEQENPADLSQLLKTLNGDRIFLKELVDTIIQDYPSYLAEIKRSVVEKNAKQLEIKAHSLKGAISNFGAKKAYDLAFELEKAGKASDFDRAVNTCMRLEQEMERFRIFFSKPGWEDVL